jgi:branched-chain amino acid transport system ATP-binding protein
MILKIKEMEVYYGFVKVLMGVSINLEEGEVVSLVGSNGAGKSTLFKTIIGLNSCRRGSIHFYNEAIHQSSPEKIARLGIGYAPEGRHIFPFLSVLENLQLGAYLTKDKEQLKKNLEKVFELFPIMRSRRNQIGATLSGGEQQMLAIGRALMQNPKLLLLDEPSSGLAPILVKELFQLIKRIGEQGKTIFLAEQNVRMALVISNRGYVLEAGSIVYGDTACALLGNDIVIRSYLGS